MAGPQRPVKGFRPGKEPPTLRARQAKQQFKDLSPTQERLLEMFAERTPQESRQLIGRWLVGSLALALALAAGAVAAAFWIVWVAVVLGVLAAGVLFLWWRLRGQRAAFEQMADMVGPGRKGRKR